MSESVNLPALGESVTEGTVTRWLKNVGDRVEVDEPLLEVSTDKVDTEIPSPIAGIIEAILVAEDETVEVGTPLVTIGTGSGVPAAAVSVAPPAAAEVATPPVLTPPVLTPPVAAPPVLAPPAVAPATTPPAGEPVPAPAAAVPAAPVNVPAHAGNDGYVTPLVRKLAHDKGVDLASVSGTGVGGRIRKQDIIDASTPAARFAPVASPVDGTNQANTAQANSAQGGSAQANSAIPLPVSPLRGTTVPMSRLRKVIAERAVASMQSSAQLTSVVEIDVTRVANFRDSVKADFQAKTGVKLSFLPFFALAAAEALKAYPIINATIEDDQVVYPAQENISIAVDTERGLLTPVIREAGSLDLAGFAHQIADLAERTRENKLKPDELAGGTFTLTNTGSRGALFDTPIVFLPQSAILGTGIVTKRPVVVGEGGSDAIGIRSMVYLALSYDHRIVDGADAARFLVAIKNRLEAGDFAGVLGA